MESCCCRLPSPPTETGIQNMTSTRGVSALTAKDLSLMDYNVYPLPLRFEKIGLGKKEERCEYLVKKIRRAVFLPGRLETDDKSTVWVKLA